MGNNYQVLGDKSSSAEYFDQAVNYAQVTLVIIGAIALAVLAGKELSPRKLKKYILFLIFCGLAFLPRMGYQPVTKIPNPIFWFPYIFVLDTVYADPTITNLKTVLNVAGLAINIFYFYAFSAALINLFNKAKTAFRNSRGETKGKPDILA